MGREHNLPDEEAAVRGTSRLNGRYAMGCCLCQRIRPMAGLAENESLRAPT